VGMGNRNPLFSRVRTLRDVVTFLGYQPKTVA
jgi:hypothetical protein